MGIGVLNRAVAGTNDKHGIITDLVGVGFVHHLNKLEVFHSVFIIVTLT